MIVAKKPLAISTVLGSCVSIILFSKINKISAMSHAQLPAPNPKTLSCSTNCPRNCKENAEITTNPNKYVTCTVRFMVEALNKHGVFTSELIASVYGGSNLFDADDNE